MLPLVDYSTVSSVQSIDNINFSLYQPTSVDLAVHRIAVPRLQWVICIYNGWFHARFMVGAGDTNFIGDESYL